MEAKKELKLVAGTMFKLLPIQVLLAVTGSISGFVSSIFASNYVGVDAMGAIGLYFPISTLLLAISTMLMGGSVIICGKYMGQNDQENVRNTFSLDVVIAVAVGAVLTALFLALGMLNLTGFFTSDPVRRPIFNRYLIGQALGMIPYMLGNQLMAFLSLENQGRRTTIASIVYIVVNLALDIVFLRVLHMEELGLAMASTIALWVMLGVELQYFFSGKSILKFSLKHLRWGDTKEILMIGGPGAASYGYQALRGIALNHLIEAFVGGVGISAFAAVNNILSIFWSIPMGMLAVSRMLMSVSIGEEDRETLKNVMFVMFVGYVPLMLAVSVLLALSATPLTMILYQNPAEQVYSMTVTGLRIVPFCMPFSVIVMHFMCYGQAADKKVLLNLLALLDGIVCMVGFTAMLIPFIGINSVYVANILNGVVTAATIVVYSWVVNRRFPRNLDELMVIPQNFGAPEDMRIDITVESLEDAVAVAQKVQSFALERGVDQRRAYAASIALEEMTGIIVTFAFPLDKKENTISVRVVYKELENPDEDQKYSPMFMQSSGHKRIRLVDRAMEEMDKWKNTRMEELLEEAFREAELCGKVPGPVPVYRGDESVAGAAVDASAAVSAAGDGAVGGAAASAAGDGAVGGAAVSAAVSAAGDGAVGGAAASEAVSAAVSADAAADTAEAAAARSEAGGPRKTTGTGDVILRIKDNCARYDLEKVQQLIEEQDPERIIGMRMVLYMAKNVEYQNILGMNALTIRI